MFAKPTNKKAGERYEKILESGLELFLEKGYQNTSLNDIVERSGGSLSTIYKFFESKEGLFKSIITRGIAKFRASMKIEIDTDLNLSLEEFLYKFSDFYLMTAFSEKSLLFYKLILSEGFRKEDEKSYVIGKLFYEEAVTCINDDLVDFFKKSERLDKFDDEDLKRFAMFFLYIIKEPCFSEYIFLDKKIKFTKKEMSEHIKRSIEMFLHGILG